MNIFHVKSNIRHNGESLTIGQFFEAEIAEFEQLVKSGALRMFETGVSMDEAKALVEKEKQDAENGTASPAPAPEAQNTWGPKKPDPEVPAQEQSTATGDIKVNENRPADVVPGESTTATDSQITGADL